MWNKSQSTYDMYPTNIFKVSQEATLSINSKYVHSCEERETN